MISAWVGAPKNWPGDEFFKLRKAKFWESQLFLIVTLKLVSIFINFLFFSSYDSPSKTMKNAFYFIKKNSFHSGDNQIFQFLSFPLFLTVCHCLRRWSKINLKVYDAINCLKRTQYHISFDILGRKKGMTLKLCP